MTSQTPLDDVAFLTRSAHRVEVLRTLADASMTRPALHEATGISQPTLGRILGSFVDRNWIESDGGDYALTPFGNLLAEELSGLLGAVETVQRLGDVVHQLPVEDMDVDVGRFASARITRPENGDVFRHVRRFETVVLDATHLRLLTDTMAPDQLRKLHQRVERAPVDDLFVESILTADALEQSFADPALVDRIHDLVESGHAPVYEHDGPIAQSLGLADGVGLLVPTDDHGIPSAFIETEDEAIRSWIADRIDDHRDASTQLTAAHLPA